MKKIILSGILAAMLLSTFSGCQNSRDEGYKERKQTETIPDIHRPGNTKRYENFR